MYANKAAQRNKIRPPRRGINGGDESFESTWNTISSAIRQIHTKNASDLSYEALYRHTYRVILKKKGEDLYRSVLQFEKDWLCNEVKTKAANLVSNGLVADLQAGGTNTTANERRVGGEKFLTGIREEWQDYQLCMSMLTDVLMYMVELQKERVYCTDNHQPSIYTSSLTLFRDNILRSPPTIEHSDLTVMDLLTRIILDQIHMERHGDIIDKHLIKSCVYMLESLFESMSEDINQRLYVTSFEQHFLDASREFYRAEGDALLRESDAGVYCRHTTKRLREEVDRCRSTLSDTTTQKIERVVEEELIENKIHDLIESESGVKFMVDNDRIEELELVYDLNARVDSKKAELVRAIQNRIVEMGTEINQAATSSSLGPGAVSQPTENGEEGEKGKKAAVAEKAANQQTLSAIKWVEDVLALKDKFDRIWKRAFESDQAMQTALTRSFAEFINSAAFPRSSEYISLFIDENMKKGIKGKTESEVDVVLEKAITLLRYVADKDLFERYYKKHLCKRLLMAKSLSNEVEQQMISRMKIELGNNFTSKLEAMFKDMTISEELTSGFKQYVANLGDPDPKRIELTVNVLTSMTWPLESMGSAPTEDEETRRKKCIFPTSIERIKKSFEQFYGEKHSGRQLTWLANMGSADIRATFPKVPTKDGFRERKHELNVSTYAMVILLLFNDISDEESLTFEEIQAKTNIPKTDLIRNLQSLAVAPKTRILIKSPMSKDVKPTDKFSFNPSFVGKFHKLKVGVVTAGNKVEGDKERKETEKKNNDSRGFCIEAAVVRIMKQRKELAHQNLVAETLSQLANQFKPDVNMIKKRIESLIEREYLERIEDASPPAYRYLA
ncbi:Cullin [Neofusicoccum parvum]|uniref:Cullin n=2 Tax=Neofusicoccum parvum TaxID=310453 RepID=A0ACB5RV12_9PEZI|nr:putative scf ubiquitin ligase subunit protein [Neofusicoccum parvum UCRNP2]GME24377.1 Cullin [Neofusicoccum parvum]GME40788.1 Cullin [Neofusicoccum parvum]